MKIFDIHIKFWILRGVILLCLNAFTQTISERNWIDSEVTFSDIKGNAINVTNSLPKGGGTYTDSSGNTYSYVIFWYKVTNESEVPLSLEIDFPAKPHAIFKTPNSHIQIVLPTEPMTSEKISMIDYGLLNLKDFLDSEFGEPRSIVKKINPKEDDYFYITVLIHEARGSARSSIILKEGELFYQLSIGKNSVIIPCGKIRFNN